jgi:hypothetical protein
MSVGQPLRGLVGQRMATKSLRARILQVAYRSTVTSLTSPAYPTIVEAWLFGAGGGCQNSGGNAGGGGGEAVWKRFRCPPNTALTYTLGAAGIGNGVNGGATALVLPSGLVIVAQGGIGGALNIPGVGGGFSGTVGQDEVHRAGGTGGANALVGAAGDHGGAGGGTLGGGGGGGGSGGFKDYGDLISGGVGATSGGSAAGFGGGGALSAPAGGGLLIATFSRVTAV